MKTMVWEQSHEFLNIDSLSVHFPNQVTHTLDVRRTGEYF